jgi:adenylate cyclase
VVGGLQPDATQAERVADMALRLLDEMAGYRGPKGERLQLRLGMHVGPAVGGVIGLKKFIYDLWGDTVNTASRMESHGVPGRVQVTVDTYQRLKDRYDFEPRGNIIVKGKGSMPVYLLIGRRAAGGRSAESQAS